MPASVEILNIPIGSVLTSSIGANDEADKNDFTVLLLWGENVDLTQSGISVSAGSSIVSFEGANSVYKATIRPPETSGIVTVTVVANAVNEGNSETSKEIRVTRFFPDVDAEEPTLLFNHNLSRSNVTNGIGIAVSPSRIFLTSSNTGTPALNYIDAFSHSGTHMPSETFSTTYSGTYRYRLGKIDYLNGTILFRRNNPFGGFSYGRIDPQNPDPNEIYNFISNNGISVTHTRLGYAYYDGTAEIFFQPYDLTLSGITHDLDTFSINRSNFNESLAHQSDLIYLYKNYPFSDTFLGSACTLVEIKDDDAVEIIAHLNIAQPSGSNAMRDIAISGDTLYLLDSAGVYTLDIKKYRPVAKRTKTTIYPVFAESGDTIDLTQFSPDAERFTFDVGFKKPPYLSINASNELGVGSGAETVFVKLKAINRIDATETDSFGFYLIIRRAQAPVWRNVSALTMRAGSSYDLFQLVESGFETPPTIAFRSGRPRPTGSRLSNGVFTIGTVGGTAAFTARKGSRSGSHIAIEIDVVQGVGNRNSLLQKNGVFRYRVEIAGIDVTPDLVGSPSVSETLDPIIINEYRVNDAAITLRNEGGKYNSALAGNFWETNGLNAGGFQNAVKIYTEHFDGNGNWIENLLFLGLILESFEPISEATFKMSCVDISSRLRKALAQDFGTLEKWDSLRKLSDEDSFEGTYIPERSLLPMQVGTGIARSDRTDLEISRLELPSEGPAEENTAYMTPMEFKTAGGFLDANPLLRFKTEHRSEDVRFLVSQLAINKEVYNTEIDIPGVEVEDPFLLNRGSVAFSVEPTRTTQLPVDWVYNSTNARILILLSNPEGHIADQLVQYDVKGDSYRVLHEFDKGIAVHRIERRSGTNYYILTSAKIQQDRSARQLPRPNDSTGYAYDSAAVGSEIKIYHYSTSTGTLTEHIAEDDNYPPQLGIHYWVGFENSLYIDEFEGIRPGYRGAFHWYSNNLYYRYAKDGEFGVARVNTSGTTTKLISEGSLVDNNHLNFAFDVTNTGDVYMVCKCSVPLASVTVVASTPIPGTITIVDDLSGYPTSLTLEINLVSVRVRTNASITINGTDASGDPQTQQIRVASDGTRTITVDPRFSTVTSVTYYNLFQGSFSITTVATSFPAFVVKRRTSGGTESTPLMDTRTLETLTDLDTAGGVYLGIHETLFHNNHLYILAQIGRVDADDSTDPPTYSRSRTKAAGMVLYRCDITAANPSLTVIDKWDFTHQAGCNLTVYDGSVHYVEQPSAATAFKPINSDLDGYWTDDSETQTMGYNTVEESLGALKKINNAGEVEHLGNVWHTDRPYNVFPTRMLSIDGDLHLCAGYGNLDELLRFNSLASGADNGVHIVYGRTLHYVLPTFQPNGRSIYAALAGLAKSVNATLSFEKNVIMITDRRPFRALTDGATGTGTADIGFSDANKRFPNSGYLLIGKEILKYTGISGGMFTGITRGVLGSAIENQVPDNSEVLYLDNIIETEGLGSPYKKITLQSDTNRIFNIIRDSGGVAEVRDEASIAKYGERPYTLDLGLTRHEKAWIEEIFRSYLEDLSELQQIANIQVVPGVSLRLGQIVAFFYAGQLKAMRIVSIRYERTATHIKGRTVG